MAQLSYYSTAWVGLVNAGEAFGWWVALADDEVAAVTVQANPALFYPGSVAVGVITITAIKTHVDVWGRRHLIIDCRNTGGYAIRGGRLNICFVRP